MYESLGLSHINLCSNSGFAKYKLYELENKYFQSVSSYICKTGIINNTYYIYKQLFKGLNGRNDRMHLKLSFSQDIQQEIVQ